MLEIITNPAFPALAVAFLAPLVMIGINLWRSRK